jgi:Zn-dependent peptidase ImmA (M78 family)
MAKLPEDVLVSYSKYNIKSVSLEYANDNDSFLGMVDTDKNLIKIRNDLKGNELVNTLLHEFIHTCNLHYGMKSEYGSDTEERFTECIANGLTDIIVRNPDIITWIEENIER